MKHLLLSFVLAILCLGFAYSEITPELLKKMEENPNQHISVIVAMNEHFSVMQIVSFYSLRGDQDSINTQVVQILQEKATRSHQWILNYAEQSGEIKDVKSFWIANMVGMKATPNAIREIAKNSEVEQIFLDEEQQFISYFPAEPERAAWGLAKIGSPTVNQTYKGKGIIVAVIDTGVNYNHVDLSGRVLKGKDCYNNDMDPMDDNGHGTHCSGTVAGTTYGVAPEATILAVKVLSGGGSGSWQNVADGVQYVATYTPKVNVASMSLGGGAPIQQVLRDALTNAVNMGIYFAIAAGNSGPGTSTIGTPGDQKDIVSVGATDSNDLIASFSSRGPVTAYGTSYIKPDVSAPGVSITSCWIGSNTASNTISGTSMATPHVAGLMALVLNAKPGISYTTMYNILTTSAKALGTGRPNNIYGYGRIDAVKAISTPAMSSQERLDIEQEFTFDITAGGTIVKNITKENPLWETNVKVWITVLNPEGTYSGTFSIIKTGQTTQSGKITNLPSNQLYYVGQFHAYEGEHTINLNAKYTGSSTAIQGTIRVKVQTE